MEKGETLSDATGQNIWINSRRGKKKMEAFESHSLTLEEEKL